MWLWHCLHTCYHLCIVTNIHTYSILWFNWFCTCINCKFIGCWKALLLPVHILLDHISGQIISYVVHHHVDDHNRVILCNTQPSTVEGIGMTTLTSIHILPEGTLIPLAANRNDGGKCITGRLSVLLSKVRGTNGFGCFQLKSFPDLIRLFIENRWTTIAAECPIVYTV